MPGQQNSRESKDSLNSSLNLWQEAVEKAGVDLEKIVNNTIEQLGKYSEELDKALSLQLKKIEAQASTIVEHNIEDLTVRADDLKEQIQDMERQESDKILTSSREARASIQALVQKTKDDIRARFNVRLKELVERTDDPKAYFQDALEKQRQALTDLAKDGVDKVGGKRKLCEEALEERAVETEKEIDGSVSGSKRLLDAKLYEYSGRFDGKIKEVLTQLEELSKETQDRLTQATADGIASIESIQKDSGVHVGEQVAGWQERVKAMTESFQGQLEVAKEESLAAHTRNLHMGVSEGRTIISQIANDAQSRLTGNHRTYLAALKRQERKYQDELKRLFSRLEQAVSEERDMPQSISSSIGNDDEMKKKLRADLEVRGSELVKTYRRQVEQIENDFSRISSTSSERIDSIRLQAVETLEKQVRIIQSELERVTKSFERQIAQISVELPEIEERGRVAAMSVGAYLNSMLTLETD
ncbi:MAG: hypothetical protein K2Z81_01320 [Cyanobacteria bacterium]|nr:hypothetical protein [Cyanobacteriota bacterium]